MTADNWEQEGNEEDREEEQETGGKSENAARNW